VSLRRPPAARQALRRFRDQPWSTRAHVQLRWLTCPFTAVEAEVPASGRVLEIGCGHGLFSLYAALASSDRQVLGVDVDADKVEAAAATVKGVPNIEVSEVPSGWAPAGAWDAIVIIDVLYLLGGASGAALLDACAAALAPGGRLVVKEIDTRPRWKYRLAVGQELAATRVTHITQGDTVAFLPPDDIAARLRAAGLAVEVRRLDRGYPHPHSLVVGRAP
jgi:cyclopropane fatty-acyl-phospholipid synthase-like methyltransferase